MLKTRVKINQWQHNNAPVEFNKGYILDIIKQFSHILYSKTKNCPCP